MVETTSSGRTLGGSASEARPSAPRMSPLFAPLRQLGASERELSREQRAALARLLGHFGKALGLIGTALDSNVLPPQALAALDETKRQLIRLEATFRVIDNDGEAILPRRRDRHNQA